MFTFLPSKVWTKSTHINTTGVAKFFVLTYVVMWHTQAMKKNKKAN